MEMEREEDDDDDDEDDDRGYGNQRQEGAQVNGQAPAPSNGIVKGRPTVTVE